MALGDLTVSRQWRRKFPAKSLTVSISAKKQEGVFFNLTKKKKESKYIYIKQVVFPSSGMLWYINEALNSAV